MNGKVSGHGMLAVTFRHQRELTGKNQTPMGHTEQRTKHARHHVCLTEVWLWLWVKATLDRETP